MRRAAILGFLVLLFQPGSARAEEALRILSPSSDWIVDFAEERCSLIREFGTGEDKIHLKIDSFGPTRGYHVMFAGDAVSQATRGRLSLIRVGYSPDVRERDPLLVMPGQFGDVGAVSFGQGFLAGPAQQDVRPSDDLSDRGDARMAVRYSDLDEFGDRFITHLVVRHGRRDGAFERGVKYLTVQFGRGTPLRLDTGSMAAPFAAMDQCVDDLVASWGIDPAQERVLSRPVKVTGLSEGWELLDTAPQDDHPGYSERWARDASPFLARNRELIPFRVMIDATGQPTACVAQVEYAGEAFRQSVCADRAGDSYQPALDAESRPVASVIQFEVFYRAPAAPSPALSARAAGITR